MKASLGFSRVERLRGLRILRRTRVTVLSLSIALLVLCLVLSWSTRDAMTHLPFIARPGRATSAGSVSRSVVDLSPWQTAQALAPLAVTAEELEFAREAERLADHEVDQAFAAALRLATLQVQKTKLSGDALALSNRVSQLQQDVAADQALVHQLTQGSSPPMAAKPPADAPSQDTDLEVAQAQLALDSDELTDAQQDLARAAGDERSRIKSELAAHEASMQKYDSQTHGEAQMAVISASRYGTLSGRLGAWTRQSSRRKLIEQANRQALSDIRTLTDQHNALESSDNAQATSNLSSAPDRKAKIEKLRDRSTARQLLAIYDDRIQAEQQLAATYSKWSAQVQLQHRILLHLILQSASWICLVLVCMMAGDGLVRRVIERPSLDRRHLQTMRMILELTVQGIGVLLILFIIFGAPHETPTILGLTTAALTFALQDFVLAFFGWFVLMSKRGLRVGDWVEINGVSGEVIELGLMTTTLLETGNVIEMGYPTGRRITFMNGYAIRGQYFNFSTIGQWMWDEMTVSLPAAVDTNAAVDQILKVIKDETQESTQVAEDEWKQATHGDLLSKFSAAPAINLRPSASGIDLQLRYVTRATDRLATRNRIYLHVIDVLQHRPDSVATLTP